MVHSNFKMITQNDTGYMETRLTEHKKLITQNQAKISPQPSKHCQLRTSRRMF